MKHKFVFYFNDKRELVKIEEHVKNHPVQTVPLGSGYGKELLAEGLALDAAARGERWNRVHSLTDRDGKKVPGAAPTGTRTLRELDAVE